MNIPINDSRYSNYKLYESEIENALNWFFRIRDSKKKGWAWVQFIEPNEQNTAEVVCAVLQNEDWLQRNADKIPLLVESIIYWLVDISHAKISIDYVWVLLALQKVRVSDILHDKVSPKTIESAIVKCLDWIISNAKRDTRKKCIGWSDNNTEISNVTRTALALMALSEELTYCDNFGAANPKVDEIRQIVQESVKWLLSVRNHDCGWGNINSKEVTGEYQNVHQFTYMDLKYQCDSNAASTGYAVLALSKFKNDVNVSHVLHGACDYLKKSQSENGGWEVFMETGIRDGTKYTFRHFSTAWALQGMLESGEVDYTDEHIIHGFKYLIELQDKNYGGFRSSPDADNYTWATCNAITTITLLKEKLYKVSAEKFLGILWDWWDLKKKDTNYSFSVGKITLAFNETMMLAFCIVYSIMDTLALFFILNSLSGLQGAVRQFVFSVITVAAAIILGMPWIVYVKNKFKSEISGWIDSVGWVYGIITGFVLVLYQFIL